MFFLLIFCFFLGERSTSFQKERRKKIFFAIGGGTRASFHAKTLTGIEGGGMATSPSSPSPCSAGIESNGVAGMRRSSVIMIMTTMRGPLQKRQEKKTKEKHQEATAGVRAVPFFLFVLFLPPLRVP